MISSATSTRARTVTVLATLLLVAVVIGVALRARDRGGDGGNLAFVSSTTTDEAMRQASATAEQIFTIRPNRVAATQEEANKALVGDGIGQYEKLYGPYLQRAQGQGVTLRTTVRSVGVMWLKADDAELLVFADQSAVSPSGQQASGPAQLVLRMQRSGKDWKVSGIRLL